MEIRHASISDRNQIEALYLVTFNEEERQSVANLAIDLLFQNSSPSSISFVAVEEGIIKGHIAYSPVSFIKLDDVKGYILAPLAVLPNRQKTGNWDKISQSWFKLFR